MHLKECKEWRVGLIKTVSFIYIVWCGVCRTHCSLWLRRLFKQIAKGTCGVLHEACVNACSVRWACGISALIWNEACVNIYKVSGYGCMRFVPIDEQAPIANAVFTFGWLGGCWFEFFKFVANDVWIFKYASRGRNTRFNVRWSFSEAALKVESMEMWV